jgi:hypothetical protein
MESKYFDNNMTGAIMTATIINGNPYPGFSATSWAEIKGAFNRDKINEKQLDILFQAIFQAFEDDYNRHPEGTKIISEYLTKDKKIKTYPKAIIESISQLPDFKSVIHKFQIYFPLTDRKGITYFDGLIIDWCERIGINLENNNSKINSINLNNTPPTKQLEELLKELKPYFQNCSSTDLKIIIEQKQLPIGRECILWISSKADAIRFIEHFKIKKAQFNKMYYFADKIKLHEKHRDKTESDSDLSDILKKYPI